MIAKNGIARYVIRDIRRNSNMGRLQAMRDAARTRRPSTPAVAAVVLAAGLSVAGCSSGGIESSLGVAGLTNFSESFQRGYVIPEGALEQVPVGSTQEQVLIVLGTPSTVATVSGEVFYYISQRTQRAATFMPEKVVDQRVVAVYFDKNKRVDRLANYGMRDGKVFDYVSRTTQSGGEELSYLTYLFKIVPL
jgi:outer membrane protein assembly factor BamE (lipoprotein component of BamABCDE complex)